MTATSDPPPDTARFVAHLDARMRAGVLCFPLTPFTADGELDLERTKYYLKGYVEKTIDKGVLPVFTEEEKKAFPYMYLAGMLYLWNWCTDYYNFPEDYNEYEWHYYLEHIYLGIKFADEHIEDLYNLIASI